MTLNLCNEFTNTVGRDVETSASVEGVCVVYQGSRVTVADNMQGVQKASPSAG